MRSDPPSTAQHFREEAKRIRAKAAVIKDEITREHMLDIAAQYDRLALNLEADDSTLRAGDRSSLAARAKP
jgi:hypothetical protein